MIDDLQGSMCGHIKLEDGLLGTTEFHGSMNSTHTHIRGGDPSWDALPCISNLSESIRFMQASASKQVRYYLQR
eukprot:1160077-Pelagomonas_calceolata.AAC.9